MTNMSETRRWLAALAACAALAARGDGASADPFIGTRGPGETTPAAAWPLGMVQPGPDVGRAYRSLPSGYRGGDAHVMGFTQNHLSGTGCCDLQDYLVKPFTGEDPLAPGAVADERAEPGYYAVSLTNFGVRAEMTATRRVALYRFTFPKGKTAKVLVDTQAGPRAWWRPEAPPSRVTESASRVAPDGVFTAENTVWCWADGRRVACALAFSRKPMAVAELPSDGRPGGRWVFSFGGATDVRAACALSSVDARGARLNLASCADPFAFDARRREAAAAWDALLGRAEIEGDARERRLFKTALYHAYFQPNLFSDVDGRCRQNGDEVVRAPGAHELYTTFSTWDTFRAAHPLYTILTPSVVPDFVASLAAQIDADGHLPIWQMFGREVYCMPGDHSVAILEEARAKGLFGDTDKEKVFAAMERSLHRRRGEHYDACGYYPYDDTAYHLLPPKPYMPVSRQLENVYDDHCAAQFAAAIGKADRAAYYRRRAGFWKNVFDPGTRMFRGKSFAGTFRAGPFDPFKQRLTKEEQAAGVVFDYTEGSAAHWAWHVLHAPEELVALHGGKAQAADDLDAIFKAPERLAGQARRSECTGQVGQYAHGNEPSHHVAFAYLYAGRPDRTAEIVREVVRRHYGDGPRGLCGNDDCGQMSAWYVFACMGLYPYDPASVAYVIGAPQARRVTIRLENGKTLTTVARGLSEENLYVQGVTWNGRPVAGLTIAHAELMKGGELVFDMGARPRAAGREDAGGRAAERPFPSLSAPRAVTRGPHDHLLANYFAINAWSADFRYLAVLETDVNGRLPRAGERCTVGLVDTQDGNRFVPVTTTACWNFQEAAMLHWLPNEPDTFVFNDVRDGAFVAVVMNWRTKAERIVPHPVSAVSRDGRWAISVNYARLHLTRPDYGYAGEGQDARAATTWPEDDGLWLVDLTTGEAKLILSVAQGRARMPPPKAVPGKPGNPLAYYCHTVFNPSATRIFFLARTVDWFEKETHKIPQWLTTSFTVRTDGTDLRRCFADDTAGGSHFNWLDDENMVVTTWPTGASGRKNGRHMKFRVGEEEKGRPMAPGLLDWDGHCVYSPNGRWMSTEGYYDFNFNRQWAIMRTSDEAVKAVGEFFVPEKYRPTYWRCDLHARWRPDGRQLAFNSVHEGSRQVYVMDVKEEE